MRINTHFVFGAAVFMGTVNCFSFTVPFSNELSQIVPKRAVRDSKVVCELSKQLLAHTASTSPSRLLHYCKDAAFDVSGLF